MTTRIVTIGGPASHAHVWVRWLAWDTWTWSPLPGTSLVVCDEPGCAEARIEPGDYSLGAQVTKSGPSPADREPQ